MDLADVIREIRDFVNAPRRQYAIMQDRRAWFQLCASMDLVEDSQLAIDAYRGAESDSDGALYLAVYGLLQAFFLQQDAVAHLGRALGIPISEDQELKAVREARNDIVGHPTMRRGKKKKEAFTTHSISRWSLSTDAIEVFSSDEQASSLYQRRFRISELIEKQRQGIARALSAIQSELARREREHVAKFSGQPLTAVFPQTLDYTFSKIAEGIRSAGLHGLARANLQSVAGILASFRDALVQRGELPANEHLEYDLAQLDYPLERLAKYLDDPNGDALSAEDAEIYRFYIERKFDDLIAIAKEIDEAYGENA